MESRIAVIQASSWRTADLSVKIQVVLWRLDQPGATVTFGRHGCLCPRLYRLQHVTKETRDRVRQVFKYGRLVPSFAPINTSEKGWSNREDYIPRS